MSGETQTLGPAQVRRRPRLPSPWWALMPVGLAGFDLWAALYRMQLQGGLERTPQLALRVQAEVAWGIVLGVTLLAAYRRFAGRYLPATVRDAVNPAQRGLNRRDLLPALVILLLYGLTWAPELIPAAHGGGGHELSAIPLWLAVAWCLADLRRYHREARRLIRQAHGESAEPESALLDQPQVRELSAEQVLDLPRLRYNLPAILALTQTALALVAVESLLLGSTANGLAPAPGFALVGLGIGLWGVWHETRKLVPRELTLALCAVRREPVRFPFVPWDWWAYLPVVLVLAAALWQMALLPEQMMRLAAGGFAAGYGLGVTPLHLTYRRPWRLAWQIIRQVKGRPPGGEG